MPVKEAGILVSQTGITSSTAAADRTILLTPRKKASVFLKLTNSTGLSTGARLEVTNDDPAAIKAGTATWFNPPESTNQTVSHMLVTSSSSSILTGVRAAVTDATWTLQVRQD